LLKIGILIDACITKVREVTKARNFLGPVAKMYFVPIRDGCTLMYHATQKMPSKAGIDQVVMIRVTKNTCPPTKSVQLEVGTGRRTVRRQLIQLTPAPL
jgi:hypothetical protein